MNPSIIIITLYLIGVLTAYLLGCGLIQATTKAHQDPAQAEFDTGIVAIASILSWFSALPFWVLADIHCIPLKARFRPWVSAQKD